jgi:outer membrane protein assembly factor BamB
LDSALDGDIYYIAAHGDSTHSGSVSAYSAASGTMLWQKDLGLNANPHISASGDTLYLSLGRSFEALRGSDGTVLWQQSPSTPLAVPPIVVDGTLYFNNYGEVFAFNASDGSPRWHFRPDFLASPSDTRVSVGGGLVFAGGATNLYALHETDGTLAWSKQYQNIVFGTTYADTVVYTSLENGSGAFMALRASDGQQLWTSPRLSGNAAFPNASHGALYALAAYVSTAESLPATIYALHPADGSIIWQHMADSGTGPTSLVVG